MTIYLNEQGTRTLEIAVTDDSYRYRAIRGEDALTLHFSSAEPVEIPVGAWTQFEDGRYELVQPGNFRKNGTRNFEYTLVMESAQAQLRKYKFRNVVDGRLEFSLTARPREHLQMLIDNLNLRETGWTAGECIDAVEKTISYNHTGCMEALNQMADEFSTEYEITGKTICLCRVEYNKDNPLPLSYGRGKGFLPGVGRSNFGDSQPVEVLFVQGGEQNIDPAQYGNKKLLLPRSAALKYDGVHFEGETGYNASAAHAYATDAEGLSLRRSDRGLQTKVEDSLDCTHIYPRRAGTAQVDAAAGTPCVFTDRSIPAGLDYSQCTVPGETMTVIFQSGMLAGREFEAQYRHDGRRFELTPQEIDGFTMPGEAFKPASGDTYAVFHIAMPGAYICDDSTRSGASWDMFREAVKYLWDNEQPKFTFSGVLDGIWAGKNWLDIGGQLRPGSYILFSDDQFQKEGIPIRIVGIRDSVNNPHSPEIELSNQPVGGSFASQLSKIGQTEVVIGDQYRKGVEYTKRRFRDSQQTISMLSEAMLDNFTSNISPVSVQTMSALVGDQSLQFRFVNNRTKPQEVPHEVAYDKQTRRLTVPRGLLQHMTLDIYTFAPSHKASEYKFWDLPAFTTPPLEDDKRYYLYAKVSTTGTAGSFRISEQAIAMKGEAGCYHLLMGVLNSAFEGERSYVSLYGFTEVLPGRITTNKIVSTDGMSFLDFQNNGFHIGNSTSYLDWNDKANNALSMKNATIQMMNKAGQTMVHISGADGSGQLAKGNITWDAAGNFKAKGGTFTDVKVKGSIRNPFSLPSDSFDVDYSDNVVLLSDGDGWINAYSIPWDLSQSGRRICLVNYRWGSTISEGYAGISAPTGKYFFEDGIQKKQLSMSREVIELMGYGDKSTFYGWIVLRRINIMTTSKYGRHLNVLAQGILRGTASGASISCKTFDDSELSTKRVDVGKYRVDFPSGWGLTPGNYIVMMTGYGGGLMKGTLLEAGTSYFIAEVSDDASRNDGSFMFQIINLKDWL